MNSKWKFIFLSTGLAAGLITVGTLGAQAPSCRGPRYIVEDLGVLGKGNNSTTTDINSVGWIAGSSNLEPDTPGNPPGPQHAFLWFGAGPLRDLGTLGGPNSGVDGPNIFGEAAVLSETAKDDPNGEDFCGYQTNKQCLGAIWRYGKLTPLRRLPGGHNAQAFEINNLGEIAGFSETGVRDTACAQHTPLQIYRYQAVKWDSDGNIHLLRPLPRDTVAFTFGINDLGQVVGSSGTCATQGLPPFHPNGLHAVLWERDGTPVFLGGKNSIAASVNDLGQVDGTFEAVDGTVHSFVWTKETRMHDIGTLPGAFLTIAGCCRTLNNRGEVTGFSFGANGSTAFLWRDGQIRDLNTLIPRDSHLQLLGAYSINDAGEIAGQGCVKQTDPKNPGAPTTCTPESPLHAFRAVPKW